MKVQAFLQTYTWQGDGVTDLVLVQAFLQHTRDNQYHYLKLKNVLQKDDGVKVQAFLQTHTWQDRVQLYLKRFRKVKVTPKKTKQPNYYRCCAQTIDVTYDNERNCLLILQQRSRPHSASDYYFVSKFK